MFFKCPHCEGEFYELIEIKPLKAEIDRLKAELELRDKVVEVAEEFVKRCELGEVRSVRTYAKFEEALAHLAGRGE